MLSSARTPEMKGIQLHVKAIEDQGEIIFSRMEIHHGDCIEPMRIVKPHGSENYNLKCSCGLELTLHSNEQLIVTRTAIDLELRHLDRIGVTISVAPGPDA